MIYRQTRPEAALVCFPESELPMINRVLRTQRRFGPIVDAMILKLDGPPRDDLPYRLYIIPAVGLSVLEAVGEKFPRNLPFIDGSVFDAQPSNEVLSHLSAVSSEVVLEVLPSQTTQTAQPELV